MTAAQAIIAYMKKEGVRKVFCVPGESYLPVLDVLHDEPSIDVISTRHEGGAAFMAEGYGKSALKPGIVFATRAVGAANLSIGVHTAYQDSTPMIVFLGQVHRTFRGREGFQEVDLDQYFRHIAKWAVEVDDAKRIPEILQRAFRIATSGRPGPVVVALPEDMLLEEANMQFGPVTSRPKPAPSQNEMGYIEKLLTLAQKPVIIAGGGIKSAQAEDDLLAFAEKYEIPVLAAFRRQDVFSNNHPLYVGHLGLGTDKKILQTVNQADVVIALGTRLSEVTTQDYSIITPDKKLIHITIDYDTIGKVYAPDIGIVADVKEALQLFMHMDVDGTPWRRWADTRRQVFEEVSSLDVLADDVINKRIIAYMAKKLPEHALLTTDAGNFAGWLHAFYPFQKKHTYVGPTSGAMGYGMPAALGAKLAFPEKTVVSLSGDGGFMMTGQELETAVRHNIPVLSLVFNNNMYGTIRMHQEMHYPEKVEATDLGDVSFKDLAISMGADGYIVRTIEAFEAAFDQALQKQKPAVIEIITTKEHISVSSTITQIRDR
ncbi:acetolactate synthase [Virgibacillus sp. NKC19-3]|uniref:thiamine pyrophosphate-dependent enzyme n=1 Tax=Virgibacillus saliphilus TaxID=2831674 RepID=UPI001C9B738E|nr:thiamine pyrophosphate-dependent enzyme [Virgibacillus sp. NKC19-3]MBY7142716.1 acetolactate synthase [Virgibacillus sp. NKC19-3]